MGPSPCYSQSQVVYTYQVLVCSSKGISGKNIILAFSHYHCNHFPDFFFSPCFKLGQSLSSCQVSEKSTHRFGQNNGTDRQKSPFIYIYIYIYIYKRYHIIHGLLFSHILTNLAGYICSISPTSFHNLPFYS